MRLCPRIAATAVVVALVALLPVGVTSAGAVDAGDDLTPDQMVAIFDLVELDGVSDAAPPAITGDPATDARIRAIAVDRGYRQRPTASVALDASSGVPLQPAASAAFAELRSAAAAAGVTITPTFGFRDVGLQRTLFLRRVGVGASDATIDAALRWVAAPGYSKHHTGYAVDVAASDGYRWLSRDNFANARRFGWLPSYPAGASRPYGPNPEPWEFVYVGVDAIGCDCYGDTFLFRAGNRYSFTERGPSGSVDRAFEFAAADDDVVIGDWDGDGYDSLATRDRNRFEVRAELGDDAVAELFSYGRRGDELFIGDWDGDGVDTLAVRRGNVFHLRNDLQSGPAHIVLGYGRAGDEVLVGDWDGDGVDTFAVRRGREFFVRNDLRSGVAEITFAYGKPGDEVVVGDWDGDGVDTFTVKRGDTLFVSNEFRGGDAESTVTVPAGADVLAGRLALGR